MAACRPFLSWDFCVCPGACLADPCFPSPGTSSLTRDAGRSTIRHLDRAPTLQKSSLAFSGCFPGAEGCRLLPSRACPVYRWALSFAHPKAKEATLEVNTPSLMTEQRRADPVCA